jgi:hypothetical protein
MGSKESVSEEFEALNAAKASFGGARTLIEIGGRSSGHGSNGNGTRNISALNGALKRRQGIKAGAKEESCE